MIRRCIGLLAVTAAVALAPVSGSGDPSSPLSPKAQASAFLARVSPETWKGAASEFLAGSSLGAANPAMAAQLESNLHAMILELGHPLGHELLSEKPLGESLIRLVYTLKFESRPAVFEFFFYRPHGIWQIVLLNIEADIGKLRLE